MDALKQRHMRILRRVQRPGFEVYLKDTNILVVSLDQEVEYNAEEVEIIVNEISTLAANEKYLLLINPGPLSTITLDALKVLARPKAMSYAHAKAYVIHTLSQRLMANFFQQVFKPRIPVRFFGNARDAEAWLLKKFRGLYR